MMMSSGGSLETDAFELKRMMRQEAHEKAFEIQVQAQRLYEKEKDKIVQIGLHSMNEDFDKKLQKLQQNLNIERSTKVNTVRLQKMSVRNDCIEEIRKETKAHMLRNTVNPANQQYRIAVKNLIIQGMIKLLEPELLIKCRREDLQMVKELLPECEKEFIEIIMREAAEGEKYRTKLTLNETEFMTAEHGGECGGILMTSVDKRIVLNNTLKSRLDLCFEELLPQIRKILFPAKVPVVEPEVVETTRKTSPHSK